MVLSAIWSLSGAQTPNRTPEKIRQDSLEMLEQHRLYPERYRFNRAPFILKDSSTFIQGYQEAIQILYNHVVDSVRNNFHSDMPDTTTVMPYSSISVAGPRVRVYYSAGLIWDETGTGSITETDTAGMVADTIAFRNGALGAAMMLPHFLKEDPLYVRLTLNGRPLFDWTKLTGLPSTLCKGLNTSVLRGKHYPPMTTLAFANRYLICDTTLNLHDQLLIEIKESERNWMKERFNITRVAASPTVDALRITGDDSRSALVAPLEKKTSDSARGPRISP
jgi:hypothetical protein